DVEPNERGQRVLTRFKPHKVPAPALVRILENLGWQRGQAWDGGLFHLHAKPFPTLGVTAVVQYDGIPMGAIVDWDDQSIDEVYLTDRAVKSALELDWGGQGSAKVAWGNVDPIVRSEVLADIAAVLEKAR